jgi:hypothetical protein
LRATFVLLRGWNDEQKNGMSVEGTFEVIWEIEKGGKNIADVCVWNLVS